jgi:23S rRNA (adenine2503-C2)-methyltransferase
MTEIRDEQIRELFRKESPFRARQAVDALFSRTCSGWADASALPKGMRETLAASVPWNMFRAVAVFPSSRGDTWKALLEAGDGSRIETVLMRNSRGQFTVCVSTQVGCAMACRFCATGRMGFTRNLSGDEIVDQVRFLDDFMRKQGLSGEITNIVFMGMGEPLANYEHVRNALRTFIDRMGIGPTRITVSTVGLVPMLLRTLDDPQWPAVRLAVSLHSADPVTRKELMPTSYDDFLDRLAEWAVRYFAKFSEKRRHLTFEYVMLSGVNDTAGHAAALVRFAQRIGKVKINLIPYNITEGGFRKSDEPDIERFQKTLEKAGVVVTRRRTMGDDIAAACGQLANKA